MNIYFTALIIILAVSAGISLLVLHIAGQLVRNGLDRAAAAKQGKHRPPSRILEDLRGVQETVVGFIGKSDVSREIFAQLIEQNEPIPLRALLRSDELADDTNSSAPEKISISLFIMRVAGLVRLTRRGVVLTDVGGEVHRRITPEPREAEDPHRPSPSDALFVPFQTETSGISHLRRVRAALQNNGASVSQPNLTSALPVLSQLRKPSPAARTSTKSLKTEGMKTTSMKRTIIMTAADHEELSYTIAAAGKLSKRGRAEMSALETELARAEIVNADDIPPDVITMNSRAELLDLESGERMEFNLVLPIDADIEAGKISVLAPLGTAMLGYRVGDEFTWTVPYGKRRLRVTAVHFQPEAALAMAA